MIIDSLQAFLVGGFSARERAGIRGVQLDAEGGTRSRNPADMHARDYAAQFRLDLHNSGVTDHEEACLWARYVMEGRPGAVSSQATCCDFADFIEREWGLAMPRFTAGAVKQLLKDAEAKLRRRRPWMRRD